ncbi:hypothetical protein JOJ87_001445 [Rhodococcus ruber]|uniref:hypothetical protein n=1 Tax=Rhodococcus ruber TaxID=1830 RepID=UPI001AE4F0C8|nr:hypothetical protein [Rhodococcus ruber]MBP2211101.1 hypothetical protein [Rhodococcus ruber]
MSPQVLVDRRTVHRKSSREFGVVEILREHHCSRRHLTRDEFLQCAIPRAQITNISGGDFVVVSHCGDVRFGGTGPQVRTFRTFGEAARCYDGANAFGCWSATGCSGYHELFLAVAQ